jgi:hypothetical protein
MIARSCPWQSLVMVLVAGLVGLASAPSRSFAQVAVTGRRRGTDRRTHRRCGGVGGRDADHGRE